jgi:alkanesulfonate monooxygenase SsuD/methylene tetrahydromethanopterin reductase-like flavin-dependent oxidoreductase (luciferase family)
MRFGLFCAPQANTKDKGPETGQGFHDWLDFNVEAERLGFHSSFIVEHHFTGWNQSSATLTMLACLAMRTTHLRVGTAVCVLPWHNPALLAEQVTTLDVMSKGRFDFGIGKGYRHNEFAGFNMPQEEAEPRFEEATQFLQQAFTSRERFSHHGRFYNYDNVVAEPPPYQQPHPPFWVGAGNPVTIARAASRGFNLILDQYASPQVLGERIAMYRKAREDAGLRFDPMQVVAARQLYIAKDKADADAALKRQAEYTARTVNVSKTPQGEKAGAQAGAHVLAYAGKAGATEENAMYGTVEQIAAQLEALRDNGVHYVMFAVQGGKEQLEKFARELMPAFATPAVQAAE